MANGLVGKNLFPKNFLKKLNDYLKESNFILLCKKHNSEIGIRFDFPEFSNIIHISKVIDIQDLLFDVDLMITDYSSVFKDFCLTGRQIIFYPFDYEEYTKIYPLYTDYFNELPGPFAKDEEELLNCLRNIDSITSNSKYKVKYEEMVKNNHHFVDGKSSERLYNYLLNHNKNFKFSKKIDS